MNIFGKVLVLLYGMGSIFCLTVAMAVYTQKMGFVTPKGESSKDSITRVDKAIEQTKDLMKANNRAYTRWLDEYEELVKLEVEQAQRRDFYRGQLELITTGKYADAGRDDPIQELPAAAAGVVRFGPQDAIKLLPIDQPTGRPPIKVKITMNPENARPVHEYLARINEAYKEYTMVQKDIEELIGKISMTTIAIAKVRVGIDQQNLIAVDADDEANYLDDFITNRRADAQLFVKRRDALKARIALLEAYNKKKAGGPGN